MKHFATVMLGFGIVLAALPTARAADTTCPPDPSPNSAVHGNLIVPTDQGCHLLSVTVTGNVQVQPNSLLQMSAAKIEGNVTLGSGTFLEPEYDGEDQTVRIGGNLTIDHCGFGTLGPGSHTQLPYPALIVGGNVLIQYCGLGGVDADNLEIGGNFTCNSSGCSLAFSNIKGNVEINNNPHATVLDNTVRGNVAVNNNEEAGVGGNTIGGNVAFNNNKSGGVEGNTIGGNLRCQGNGQIGGGGNTVGGHKTGQCTNF
jgi:hypothetical protein